MIGSDPTFSVSEFVAVFNQSMEMMYPQVIIAGELANYRVSKNRWLYFDLKDQNSSVKFFGSVFKLPGPLEEGMNLEVFGYPRLHPRYGFSINVERIKVAGEGSIARAKQLLMKKLETEGLFGPDRKRVLPYPPTRIGLVTSVESAAYSDFVKVLNHRWGNVEIQLIDCLVQGEEAPSQIVEAVNFFSQTANPPDIVSIIRGGGSADDLAAFDAEQVVRAIASSRVPTLVAIGHERDLSMAELVADKRASTPSNAAELLVPDKTSEQQALLIFAKQLDDSLTRRIEFASQKITEQKANLDGAMLDKIKNIENLISQSNGLLRAYDPKAPLKRGFAMVHTSDGRLVKTVSSVKVAQELIINVADGQIDAKVLNKKANE